MRQLYLAVLLLAASPFALADAKAVISGPNAADPGMMFVLDSSASVGEAKAWIAPPAIGANYIECGGRFATAISKAGTYEFLLVVSDTTPEIAFARHVVVVGRPEPVPDPIPDDPGDDPVPDKPTPVPVSAIEKASAAGAGVANDPVTAKALAQGLRELLPSLEKLTQEQARKTVGRTIEGILLERTGVSRDADWLQWRSKVDAAFKSASIKGLADYLRGVTAIIDGLLASQSVEVRKSAIRPVLRYYTTSECVYCRQWEREVMPQVTSLGIDVLVIKDNHDKPRVPTFEFNGTEHVGYLTFPLIKEITKL